MPPLRKPRPSTDRTGSPAARFTDTFAQRPAVPRRGLVPGVRVWATVGATAGLTVVSVLAFPLLARVDLFPDGDAAPAVAVADQRETPGPAGSSASAAPAKPGNPSPDSAHSAGGAGNNAAGVGGSAAGGAVGSGSSGGSAGGTAQQPSGGGGTQSGTGGQSGGTGTGTGKTPDPKPANTGKPSGSSGSGTPTTTVPGTLLIGSASGRCVDVSNANNGVGKDGTRLQIWDCGGAANQKWVFRSDGTVRSLGMCMDVAWGSTTNGAAIQLAKCSGNRAQLFYLSTAGDLVNSQADKCVDIVDNGKGNGAKLQLWTCSGTSNQKWRKG